MLEELFELIVMLFGLTNLLATFWVIMIKILRNLINTGKLASLIDDVILEIEKEKGHDKTVKEVVKRLEQNNSYVKPEKCKLKVKKVKF